MGSAFPITTAAKTILTGTALLLLSACASAPVTSETDKPIGSAQILSICEKLAKSNDTRIAIGLCEKAHVEDPDNPVPLLILGDMLQQQGALAQAGRAYGLAIDLDPENVEAHYGLGKVFLARNQYQLATEQFEVARELNARDHRLYNALGVVLDNLGDHVAAQEHYRVGLQLAPNNRALKKNLTLSRSLDDSVISPAIGPRFDVVPGPASTPGGTPNGGGERVIVPGTVPQQRQDPGAPAGRLGHEPLAYAPNLPPQKNPYIPDTKSFAAQASNRQFTVTGGTAPSAASFTGADVIGPDEFPATIQARVTAAKADPSYLAYFPIVAPTQSQTVETVQAAQPQKAMALRTIKRPVAVVRATRQDGLPYIQPTPRSIHATAAPVPAADRTVEDGPRILASGLRPHVVNAEILAEAPAPQATQIAALPPDTAEIEKPLPEDRVTATPGSLSFVPTSVAEGLTAETSASSMLVDFDVEATPAPAPMTRLTLGANRYGAEKATADHATALPSVDAALPRVPQSRFGREYEGDHETRHVKGEFWDLVDVVNPMQHIPLVASIYRDVTEDEIRPAAKIAGGTLFGGVLGFASSIVDSVMEEASGQDMTQTAVAAFAQQEVEEDLEIASFARREREAARRLLQQTRR